MAKIPVAGEKEIELAIAAARRAQPGWANTPALERAKILRKFAVLVAEHGEQLAEVRDIRSVLGI